MRINMPENANRIIETLEAAGYEAYIVGGCVRDSILGRTPGDWDITTSAKPEQIKALFRRTVDTGIQHGTVTVMFGKEGYEVTTYRIDGEYTDHRRPDKVLFTTNLKEDLKRRDFTINAMAYNHRNGIIDIFGGVEDLEKRVIRAVGVAEERFSEDALRILRAVRFSGQLDFTIDEDTQTAMKKLAGTLSKISAERIRVELDKLFVSDHPEKLIMAYEMGITAVVLPEFDRMMEQEQNNPYHLYNVGVHSIYTMKAIDADSICRWAALLHDVGKPDTHTRDDKGIDHFYGHNVVGTDIAKKVLRRMKWDNDTIKQVSKMVYWHDYGMGGVPSVVKFRRALAEMGADFFPLYDKIKRADMAAQSDYRYDEKKAIVDAIEEMYRKVMADGDCLTIRELAINGRDLKEMGIAPGKQMGDILEYLLEKVLEVPHLNNRETLEKMVADKYLK